MSDLQATTVLMIACAVTFGMVMGLLGSLKLALARRVNLRDDRLGTLLGLVQVACIPLTVLSGLLVDRCGVTGMILFGSFAMALGLFGLALRPRYAGALT